MTQYGRRTVSERDRSIPAQYLDQLEQSLIALEQAIDKANTRILELEAETKGLQELLSVHVHVPTPEGSNGK